MWDGASVARKHGALWAAASELIAAVCHRTTLPLATFYLLLATCYLLLTTYHLLPTSGVPRVPLDDDRLQ